MFDPHYFVFGSVRIFPNYDFGSVRTVRNIINLFRFVRFDETNRVPFDDVPIPNRIRNAATTFELFLSRYTDDAFHTVCLTFDFFFFFYNFSIQFL